MVPAISRSAALALWVGALALLGVMATRCSTRGRRTCLIAVVALAAAAASASHVALAQHERESVLALGLQGGRALTLHATVVSKIEVRGAELEFDAAVSRIEIGDERHLAHVDVTVWVAPADVDDVSELDVGAGVVLQGTARAARPGDRAVLGVSASRGVQVVAVPQGVLAGASALRRGLVRAVVGLPEPGAELVPGLAVGDTSAVDPALDEAMKSSSLSHLTAVSGANCAIVVGLAFACAAAAGVRRSLRVAASIAALSGFIVLVTPEPSVVRAAAMAAVAMLGVLLGRPAAGISILALCVAVLLIGDPWLANSLGFALSVAATASLLLLAGPLAGGMGRWMPRPLALALSVPLAAQLACGPLLVLIQPMVPLFGVVANLIAAPAAPIATIAGVGACLASALPPLQWGLAAIAWLPSAWIAATAMTMSTLPGGQLPWMEGWPGAATLALFGAAVVIVMVGRSALPGRLRPLRAASAAVIALILGVCAGSSALGSIAGVWTLPAGWSVLACDIGQGDAVVIRSGDARALIDTGPDPARLAACLTRLGIERIDLLVLTHYDLDHVGGVDAVRGMVETVVHGPPASAADRAIVDDLVASGADSVAGWAGLRGTLGSAQWRVLWPRAGGHAFPSGNDASVVLDVRGAGMPTAIFLGDMSASSQHALLESGVLRPPYDVVKVAHHGSADQDPDLYLSLHASVAVISVGLGNDYGHPRAETIAFLDAQNAFVARTDLSGIVAVWPTESGISVWRERAPPG
jgi:competence protein ComEC